MPVSTVHTAAGVQGVGELGPYVTTVEHVSPCILQQAGATPVMQCSSTP